MVGWNEFPKSTFHHQEPIHHSAETVPLSHRDDPATSYEAADKMVKSGKLARQEQGVFNDICRWIIDCDHKDFTAREIADWVVSGDYYKIQRRLSGLRNKGKIERTGEKRNGCRVWRLTMKTRTEETILSEIEKVKL